MCSNLADCRPVLLTTTCTFLWFYSRQCSTNSEPDLTVLLSQRLGQYTVKPRFVHRDMMPDHHSSPPAQPSKHWTPVHVFVPTGFQFIARQLRGRPAGRTNHHRGAHLAGPPLPGETARPTLPLYCMRDVQPPVQNSRVITVACSNLA